MRHLRARDCGSQGAGLEDRPDYAVFARFLRFLARAGEAPSALRIGDTEFRHGHADGDADAEYATEFWAV